MIRPYQDSDYEQLKELYSHTEWYGGVFDEARDGRERLAAVIKANPDAILVYERESMVFASISIIDDGRVAMLYRFVVPENHLAVARELYESATSILKLRGHAQILVYSAPNNPLLDERYLALGMTKGGNYSCFWADI